MDDDDDISRLGKSLDDEIEAVEKLSDVGMTSMDQEAADVLFQEMSGELSGWKSKYFTVLGFFLVFLAFFLVIIAVLVYKIKTSKNPPPPSPGAGLNVPGQRSRGYSNIEGDNSGDTAPLTPATHQAQAFQY